MRRVSPLVVLFVLTACGSSAEPAPGTGGAQDTGESSATDASAGDSGMPTGGEGSGSAGATEGSGPGDTGSDGACAADFHCDGFGRAVPKIAPPPEA